jgi:hypothetical protein
MKISALPLLAFMALACLPATGASAEQRSVLGWGRLFSNDALGDLQDRWRSGSYTVSHLRGPAWTGQLPSRFGELLEYRFNLSTLTADHIADPRKDDRRFAGPLSLGLHTHTYWQGYDTSVGADLVAIGPQTGVGRAQIWLHDAIGVAKPDLSNQMENAFLPTFKAEMGRNLMLAETTSLRPFVAAQAGSETLVRAGGDLMIGSFGIGALMLREEGTGQRFRGVAGDQTPGATFTLGGDVAHVFDSAYLPEGGPAVASETRSRFRAGMAWQGQKGSAFYGLTYLSPEFDSQPTGQLVGSVNLNLRF